MNRQLPKSAIATDDDIDQRAEPQPHPTRIDELAAAVIANDLERVEELLEKGADPEGTDSGGNTPIGYARARSLTKMIEALQRRIET